MGSYSRVLWQKLASLIHAVFVYLLPVFSFVSNYISRLQKYGGFLSKNEKEVIYLDSENDDYKFGDFVYYDAEEKDKTELHLKFKFPTFEEFNRLQEKTGDLFDSKAVVSCASKYEAPSGESPVSAFVQEFETFPVKEIDGDKIIDSFENLEVLPDRGFVKVYEDQEFTEMEFTEVSENQVQGEEYFQGNQEFLDESHFFCDKNRENFLSDGDFEDAKSGYELSGLEENQAEKEKPGLQSDSPGPEENQGESGLEGKQAFPGYFPGEQESDTFQKDFLPVNDFRENSMENKSGPGFISEEYSEKPCSNDSSMADPNKLESLWEHQELIEQLKMELKKVRATGLPTILEESESPKITDDLKPWKIDEKFQHEDCMGALHKFYKSYNEMMRKFDILNYQKMYAMGFLQLKDPFQATPHQRHPPPSLKSLLSQNLWLFRHKSHGSDPIKKFVSELQGDLEAVYVGQMCLSWEFLHFQYEKALNLWHSDPHGIHRYNEVAGEFQQFQVLVQRFIEDEPFHGPRVQSFIRSRCVLRNLLQVPLIREDKLTEKMKAKKKDNDEYVITSEMLVDILEESIRIFWVFVRSDKDSNVVPINGHKKMKKSELHNPQDLKLLLEVRKSLQKNERKVKDILRSENCILRKFRQSREEDHSDQALYFFSQVDMKLVSRVLNMPKITREQLLWCQNKLSRISFVNRKIYLEPAFLLFPC